MNIKIKSYDSVSIRLRLALRNNKISSSDIDLRRNMTINSTERGEKLSP